LSIVTHDLNNPLQSLVVLLELSIDDAPAGSEARMRAEQCQLAAERIRSLSAALAGLLRGRREDGPRIWARAEALLARRFERVGVVTRVDVSRLADIALPSDFFLALCGSCLLLLATGANAALRSFDVGVLGGVDESGRAHLDLTLVAIEPGVGAPPTWDEDGAARLRALVAPLAGVLVAVAPGSIRLTGLEEDAVT